MQLDKNHHRAAIDMLNKIHERLGFETVYRIKMHMLSVDKIAERHITKAFEAGIEVAQVQAQEQRVKSFAETHPANPKAKCKCEHWQSCMQCHPTAWLTPQRKPLTSAEDAWIARKRETFPKDYEERRFANWAENGRWEFMNGWNACVKAYKIKEQS